MRHTAQDRCDRCPAQGYTTWFSPHALPLTFCGHHSNAYANVLTEQGFELGVDDTPSLYSE